MLIEAKPLAFLNGGGEMGELIRSKDWESTTLGAPDTWPQTLRIPISLLLNSQLPMFLWWGKELITFYNDAYRSIAGGKHPSLLGKPGNEAWAEIWHDLEPLVESVFNGVSTWSDNQLLMINRKGYIEETYFTFSYSPVYDEDGKVAGLFCACIETTEKVMDARRVKQSEQNLRNTILQAPVAMGILKGPSHILEIANEAMLKIIDRPASALGQPVLDTLPEIRNQGFAELLQEVYTTGIPYTATERPVQLLRNGKLETVIVNFVYEPFKEIDGTVTGIIVVATDITEQVLIRQKIEKSENYLQAILHATPECIKIVEPNGILQFMNHSGLNMIEADESVISKACVFDVIAPEYKSAWIENHRRVCAGESLVWEYDIIGLKGTRRHMETHAVPLPGEYGNSQLAVTRDITESKQAALNLQKSEERTRLAIEAAQIGFYEIDVNRQFIVHSPLAAEIMGRDPNQQWPYQVFVDAIIPEDRPIRERAHQEAKTTGRLFYEARIATPNNEIRWVRLNGTLINQDNQPTIIGTILNITDEKKASELLEHKIEERTKELQQLNNQLSQFSYAASHDLQEPLRKVNFFVDRLINRGGLEMNEENKKVADRIFFTTNRMRTLIDDLLNYSNASLGTTGFTNVELTNTVKEVMDDMEATIIENQAMLQLDELPVVKGDPRQLKQMFQNLISNAIKYHNKAVPPQINISCSKVKGSAFAGKIPFEKKDELFYEIRVADNGIGFEDENKERIFNLFQRLHGKSEYEGTGIGLAIVKKVVENHHGFITAESTPGVGSTFSVLLPAE